MARIGTLIRREIIQIAAAAQKVLATRVSKIARQNRELRQAVRRQATMIDALKARRAASAPGPRPRAGVSMSAAEIRDLRANLGLSRARFANLAGVSAGAIYLWESGRSAPRASSVARLRKVAKKAGGRVNRPRKVRARPGRTSGRKSASPKARKGTRRPRGAASSRRAGATRRRR